MKIIKPLFIILLILGIFGVVYSAGSKNTKATISYPPVAVPVKAEDVSVKEMASGDGIVKVTAKIQKSGNLNTYIFTVTNTLNGTSQKVYEVSEDPSVSYLIPGNSWAPTDKQFFIIRSVPGSVTYLVFKADGSNYANGQKYLDIIDYWSKTKHTLSITDATGWGGEDLVVLTTKKDDGTIGPNFWFVVSSHSFMQLSH